MILVRRLLGDVLRGRRQRSGRTLRQLAATARVSPGYLSEVERGQKEPSSELLAAICDALEVKLSDVLLELSTELAAAELAAEIEAAELGRLVPADGGGAQRVPMPPARTGQADGGAGKGRTPAGA
ncbi:helix-turn-helix transcriptional regulator, partial [Catenulispora yoronensis]|uniref:helix-turn-helix domain-containing protein n=1 Tax=Catenulispora yoronensis TaxID=450799 RepID=UPI0031CEC9B3